MSNYESQLKATVASTVLGRPKFVREVSENHLAKKRAERSQPAVKQLAIRPSIDEIMMKVNEVFGEREDLLRNANIYCCQKYSGAKLKEIGERFGISDAAISQASRRLVLKACTDKQLKNLLDQLEAVLRAKRRQ